jgi:solute carrier family 12 sodium/potassium/chloride transporter 2
LSGCLVAMFLINPIFSLVAITVVILFYAYLSRLDLHAPWSDVRSGLFVTLAEWAAMRVNTMPTSQERAWKPSLLVPVQSTQSLRGSYRFLKALTHPQGSVHVLGFYRDGQKEQLAGLESFVQAFAHDQIFARVALLAVDDYAAGMQTGLEVLRSVFFRPNILFMPVRPDSDQGDFQYILDRAAENDIGAILFAKHPESSMGHEQTVNVWIRDQSPDWEVGLRLSNLDLALLLAYQLARNWNGNINLITIIADSTEQANGQAFMADLVDSGRMPHNTHTVVETGTLEEYLPRAPQADLNIFGLQQKVDLPFTQRMVKATNASCIFVRDSGHESALA